MSRFVILFARYIAAICVACAVSAAVFFPASFVLMFLSFAFHSLGLFIPYVQYALLPVMGFCGVYSGCLCLERTSRRFGSIVLLVLDLAYYVHWMVFLGYREGENEAYPYIWVIGLVALALGGLAAVIFIFRRTSPNKSLQATAAAPSSCD
jgi:hypothetical protein